MGELPEMGGSPVCFNPQPEGGTPSPDISDSPEIRECLWFHRGLLAAWVAPLQTCCSATASLSSRKAHPASHMPPGSSIPSVKR